MPLKTVHSMRTLISSCLTGFLFPADPQNRLCKNHYTLFQAFDFYKFICPVHAIVNFKVRAAERDAVFQVMDIRSAADRKGFSRFAGDIGIALQQRLNERAVRRNVVWREHGTAFHGKAAFFHILFGSIIQVFFCRAERGTAVVGTGQDFAIVVHEVEA